MSLNGVMILDKPADMSSARAVAKVKKLLGVKKIGHTGTLDPFATGVLICCINQATRLARFFLHDDKSYQAVLRLGVQTDTLDATGQPTAQADVPPIGEDRLSAVFSRFKGRQLQLPPVYAALKHQGTPLYKLARRGRPVQKPARPIEVKSIGITWIDLPDIGFELTCSSGTYVRALCADIGKAIGCGGHLARLRRTASSGFTVDQAVTLAALETMDCENRLKSALMPMNSVLAEMPTFIAGPEILERITHGKRLTTEMIPSESIWKPKEQDPVVHLKVTDVEMNLKAVLKACTDGTNYDYCCVFH